MSPVSNFQYTTYATQKLGIMQIHLPGDIGIPKANDMDLGPGEIQAAIKPGRVKAGYRLKL